MASANFKSMDEEGIRRRIALYEWAAAEERNKFLGELNKLANIIDTANSELQARGATDLPGNRVALLRNTIQGLDTGDLDANTSFLDYPSGAGHTTSSPPAPVLLSSSSPLPNASDYDSAEDAEGEIDETSSVGVVLDQQQACHTASDPLVIPDTAGDVTTTLWKDVDDCPRRKGKKAYSIAESWNAGKTSNKVEHSAFQKQPTDRYTGGLSCGRWEPVRQPGSQDNNHGVALKAGFNCPCNISDDADNSQMIQCTNYDKHDPSGQRQGGIWHKICVNLLDTKTGTFDNPQDWKCHQCSEPKARVPGYKEPRSYGEMRIFWTFEAWRAQVDFIKGQGLTQNEGVWKWMKRALLEDFGINREPTALRTYQHHCITGTVEARGKTEDSRPKGMLKCYRDLFVNHGVGHLANIFMKYNTGVNYRLPVEDPSAEAQKTLTPTTQKDDDAVIRSNLKEAKKAAAQAAQPPKQPRARKNTAKRGSTAASTPSAHKMSQPSLQMNSLPSPAAFPMTPAASFEANIQDSRSLQQQRSLQYPQSIQQPYLMQPMPSKRYMQSAQSPSHIQYGQPTHYPMTPQLPQYSPSMTNSYPSQHQSLMQNQSSSLYQMPPQNMHHSQQLGSVPAPPVAQQPKLPQKNQLDVYQQMLDQQTQSTQYIPGLHHAMTTPLPSVAQGLYPPPAAYVPSQSLRASSVSAPKIDKGKGRKRSSPEPEHPSATSPKKPKTPPTVANVFALGYGQAGPSTYNPDDLCAPVETSTGILPTNGPSLTELQSVFIEPIAPQPITYSSQVLDLPQPFSIAQPVLDPPVQSVLIESPTDISSLIDAAVNNIGAHAHTLNDTEFSAWIDGLDAGSIAQSVNQSSTLPTTISLSEIEGLISAGQTDIEPVNTETISTKQINTESGQEQTINLGSDNLGGDDFENLFGDNEYLGGDVFGMVDRDKLVGLDFDDAEFL